MYSKQQASQLRQQFWTVFGQYMAPVLSAEGEKVNWVNYKTGEKDLGFRMYADNKEASIGIVISHKDAGLRHLYFDQLAEFRKLLETESGEPWQWERDHYDEQGRALSRVSKSLTGVSVFQKEDWPQIISFLKPRLMALDAFWSQVKYSFEMLR
jgi:hypothetical protein